MRDSFDVSARTMEADARWSAWMVKAQDGDATAYEALLRDCVPHIRRVARALGTPDDYIDDVVQETLFTVDRARHAFQPGRSFAAWLNAIARRRAIDALRALGRQHRREVHEPVALESHPVEGADDDPLAAIEAAERDRRIRAAVADLSPGQRIAVEVIGLGGKSLEEAAAATGKSKGALKVSLHRAVKLLRERLGRDG